MTCPHCGATARDNERFCPSCSRLVNSPLLKMRQELDAARAAMRREQPPPLARAVSAASPPAPSGASATPPKLTTKQLNERRKAEIRQRLAAQRLIPPPSAPREVHTRGAHDSVPDNTLEQALRSQAAPAADALERARQGQPQATPPRPPRGQKPAQPKAIAPAPPAAGQATDGVEPGRRTPAVVALVLVNLATLLALVMGLRTLKAMPEGSLGHDAAAFVEVVAYVAGGLVALATLGLWAVVPFGRALQRLVSLPWLVVFPFGTLFAFINLIYLASRGARLLFSGRGGATLDATERLVLARHRKFAPLVAMVVLVVGGMACLNAVGVAGALRPLLLERGTLTDAVETFVGGTPAQPADPLEAALADLETYARTQVSYAQANAGYFDRTECLVSNDCVAGRQLLPSPLDARYLEPRRYGFEFRARLGPPPEERGANVSPTSVLSFTYVAVPVDPAAGAYGYCIDLGLAICRFDARAPVTSPPDQCPADCEFVR